MDPNVENALWLCGSDRVFKREVSIVPGASPAGVAIRVVSADELARRVEGTAAGSFVRMVKADGSDINEAGDAAATAYASHLRAISKGLVELSKQLDQQADRIDAALKVET